MSGMVADTATGQMGADVKPVPAPGLANSSSAGSFASQSMERTPGAYSVANSTASEEPWNTASNTSAAGGQLTWEFLRHRL